MDLNLSVKSSMWKTEIKRWLASGISARKWCQENKIVYTTFLMWRNRLQRNDSNKVKVALNRSAFVEMPQVSGSKQNDLIIEYQGFQVRTPKNFDSETLLECLKVIRSL